MSDNILDKLLSSGLPLEQEIAEIAYGEGFLLNGEFSYLRKTETGTDSEFSVDIHAESSVKNSSTSASVTINALMECKYSSPGVEWIFSSLPDHAPGVISTASYFQWLGGHIILRSDDFDRIEPEHYCSRGISLSSKSSDTKQIRHGLQQLRHAIPHLLDKITTIDIEIGEAYAPPIIAPMLVTNAPMRVLNPGVTITDIKSAKTLDSISSIAKMVCHYQPGGPELLDTCMKMEDKINKKYDHSPIEKIMPLDIFSSIESVPIVSIEYLKTHLSNLKNFFSKSHIMSSLDYANKFQKTLENHKNGKPNHHQKKQLNK